jgi:hypothetical protein
MMRLRCPVATRDDGFCRVAFRRGFNRPPSPPTTRFSPLALQPRQNAGIVWKTEDHARVRTREVRNVGKIFISYRRDDSMMLAKSIYDWLSHCYPSNDIFMDVDSIAPGVDFRAPIETAIIQSGIVFVVIGPKWLAITDANGRRRLDNPNDFVRFEIEMAMRHKIPIVPLLIQGTTMPVKKPRRFSNKVSLPGSSLARCSSR